MLQAFRSKAGSLFIKVLFGILILSFAAWGIGDMFRQWGSETAVATVGSTEINPQRFQEAVRQEVAAFSRNTGMQLDVSQAKQFGLGRGNARPAHRHQS